MNLAQFIDWMRSEASIQRNITGWHVLSGQPASWAPLPERIDPRLARALLARGVERLYSHQAEAIELALAGRDVVVVTPTASGKTLCYNVPVLQSVLADPAARALYLFPTKALSQDQLAELNGLAEATGTEIKCHTYDGDTQPTARQAIRQAGHIVVTNPDMLHTGILPHHTKWVKLFENLRYVVIDEVHHYRGVFGSHLANLVRRLVRIAEFYGSTPTFIACSATIANPGELVAELVGRPVAKVDRNGAPRGEKHFVFYNPPVVNQALGIRRSATLEAERIASQLMANRIQTVVFGRSRTQVEVLLSNLQSRLRQLSGQIAGYRGGYLPSERRNIERRLRAGELLGVISTNALELGIDIGQLEACVMTGYPGSIASTWQQAGRAGRRQGVSLAVMVASSSPLDQFLVQHPEYVLGQSPEHALVNPDNLAILASHLKCAAFELPFREHEAFGADPAGTREILGYLAEHRVLRHAGGRWHWMAESFPAEEISLRSASQDNVVIIDTSRPEHRVIGETDRFSAPVLVHEDAIYLHGGVQYHVDRLDWEEGKAYVRQVDVDYYTDANLAVTVQVIDEFRRQGDLSLGEVMVSAVATVYKKLRLETRENVGWGKIHLPEQQMHTSAAWLTVGEAMTADWAPSAVESALVGLANLLGSVAPIFLMCDRHDLRVVPQVRSPFTDRPTIFLYDACPGGVGLADKLFGLRQELLSAALDRLRGCDCPSGCPSCVGPAGEVGEGGKVATARLVERLMALRGAAGWAGQ